MTKGKGRLISEIENGRIEVAPASGETTSKFYSVLLLYPDWANDDGAETYYAFVEASEPAAAVAEARRQALEANGWTDIDPTDFAPLLVTEGRITASA